MTKFKLTNTTLDYGGVTLHRIKYEDGSIGGWIEKIINISENATVWGDAKVFGDAQVFGNAKVFGEAEIFDNARVGGNAVVLGYTQVYGNAQIYDSAEVGDHAQVYNNARVFSDSVVGGNARVGGNATIWGRVQVFGNAEIMSRKDYIVFKNWWSSGRYFTWTRSNNMWKVGCFYGTGEELIKKAYQNSEISGREYERVVRYVESTIEEGRKIK